jgi:hypothetical protein
MEAEMPETMSQQHDHEPLGMSVLAPLTNSSFRLPPLERPAALSLENPKPDDQPKVDYFG